MNWSQLRNIVNLPQEESYRGQSEESQKDKFFETTLKQNLNNNQTKFETAYYNLIESREQTIQKLPNINYDQNDEMINNISLNKSFSRISRARAVSQGQQSDVRNLSQILEYTNLDPRTKRFGFNVYKHKKSYAIPKKYIKKPQSVLNTSDIVTNKHDDIKVVYQPAKIYNQFEKLVKQNIFNEFNPDLKKFKLDIQVIQQKEYQSIPNQKKTNSVDMSQFIDLQQIDQNELMRQKNQFKPTIKDQRQSIIPDLQNQYLFRIVKGRRVQNEELEKLQSASLNYWNTVNNNIRRLERLLTSIGAPLGFIEGRKILKPILKKKRITLQVLISSILNREDFEPRLSNYLKEKFYQGQSGLQKAAIKIQTAYRGYRERKKIQGDLVFLRIVKKIQLFVRSQYRKNQTRKLIFEINHQRYENFLKMQQEFKNNWEKYENQPVIEIHVVSSSYPEYTRLTMEKFIQRENQIGRIFRAKNPNVTIVYITPYEFDDELSKYYDKIFQLNEIDNFYQRVKILTPELYDKFPGHFSLLQILLYSPKCLNKLKKLISGKKSYIVPSCCSNEYIQLATILKCPLYAGTPQQHFIASSKSGARQLFQQCEIPVAPGISEIYEEQEMINSLTILIVTNPGIRVWLFKMDDTFSSRGIATFSIDSVKGLQSVIKSQVSQLLAISVVKDLIQMSLPSKLNIVYKRLYSDYKEFMSAFLAGGGIIEACPEKNLISKIKSATVFFDIYPNGIINFLGSYEKIQGQPLINIAYQFPQTVFQKLEKIIDIFGKILYSKEIFGYISVDFLLFKNQSEQKFWATGLDCYMNNQVSAYFYFDFLVGNKQQRMFLFCPFVTHPSLSYTHIHTFFHMCRLERISYDIEKREGTCLLLPDIIQSGFLSLMTIGIIKNQLFLKATDPHECVQLMNQFFVFIGKLVGDMNVSYGQSELQSRSDIIQLSDIYGKLKCLESVMNKKQ